MLNALFLGGGEGLALLQGLIVTALLGPVAIGLYGIVTTTAMTIVQLRRVGIDEAFVQQSEADQEEEFQRAFSLELAVGLAFSLLVAAIAPVLAAGLRRRPAAVADAGGVLPAAGVRAAGARSGSSSAGWTSCACACCSSRSPR